MQNVLSSGSHPDETRHVKKKYNAEPMKFISFPLLIMALLLLGSSYALAQDSGTDRDTLNKEVLQRYNVREYVSAVEVAKRALEFAETNSDGHDDYSYVVIRKPSNSNGGR